jgi:small multidrug resistance pump
MNRSLQKWLKAAAVYNILWGAITVLFPYFLFDACGLERPLYPEIWQCVGMIVGVYGVGYYVAARNYVRHWPIVLVGFMGKIAGPLGFAEALSRDRFNWAFGSTIIFNDLIWWIPFALMLNEAWRAHRFRE